MEAAGCTSRSLDRSLTDKTELWLRLKLVALAGLMAMISLQGSKCLGATSEDSTENIERPFPTVTELPFQLYNDNLIVVKGSIGPISGVNLILDTGTTPSAISKGIATRLNPAQVARQCRTVADAQWSGSDAKLHPAEHPAQRNIRQRDPSRCAGSWRDGTESRHFYRRNCWSRCPENAQLHH